ncbi:hypothetical protein CsSME_00027901 [Camellia sinensis var. sinensis]
MIHCNIKNPVIVIGKTIHVLNKNEHALDMAAPVHDHLGDPDGPIDDTASVKKRTNVLLLGDHIGDLGMSDDPDTFWILGGYMCLSLKPTCISIRHG